MTDPTREPPTDHDPAPWLADRLRALRAEARRSGQRRALLLLGPEAITRRALAAAWACLEGDDARDPAVWLGDIAPAGFEALPPSRARAALGRQLALAVIDLHDGCWPDALGAVSGAIGGGGLLVLRAPPRQDWLDRRGARAALAVEGWPIEAVGCRFPTRLARVFAAAAGVETIEWGAQGPAVTRSATAPPAAPPDTRPTSDPDCLTADQAAAVAAVIKVATGRRKRPVVLVADRGRGKSAALGIAAGRLLRDGALDGRGISLIAPARSAVEPVFAHARRLAGGAVDGPAGLRFVAPAELAVAGLPEAGLILVDEAAALPVDLLGRVLAGHPRVAFSTTVHGYEGTGRGFAIRFTERLDAVRPHWRQLRLEAPIRYRAGDPVEAAVFRALLLDARPIDDGSARAVDPAALLCAPVDRDALASDGRLLERLFGLLVAAHYRTSPADLERLLDAPNVTLWTARRGPAVLAAAWVSHEGGLDEPLSRAIHRGERRPNGHMLPETLAAHLGLVEAPRLGGWRVVRIASHPAAWGRGVGSRLLAAIAEGANAARVDYLGSAFGATPRLLRFWRRAGYAVARVGLTRGRSSGLHSAVVLRPCSTAGEALVAAARSRFAACFPLALSDPLRDLAPEDVGPLFTGAPVARPRFSDHERGELALFAEGRRVTGAVIDLLWRLAPWAVADQATSAEQRALLVACVLQRRPAGEAAEALGLAGRRAVARALGAAVTAALKRNAA